MTHAQKAGLKVGDVVEVVWSDRADIRVGERFVFDEDDGSKSPWFKPADRDMVMNELYIIPNRNSLGIVDDKRNYKTFVRKEKSSSASLGPSVEHTGGSSSYYQVRIESPTTATDPYDAECNDIIEALGMTFAEGNAFKAIWRTAAARTLGKQKKGNNALYDAEKVVFFGERMIVAAGAARWPRADRCGDGNRNSL